MPYGIKLKKYGKMVRGFNGSKADAERLKADFEKQGIKAQIISLKGAKGKVDKVA
jgi:hypothetical protein